MRKEFISTLVKLAEKDERIFLLTGDLGFSVLEDFKNKFPNRYINVGIAEQNMMGIASGLALSGKIVFVYSIIPFLTMRCFEQIRVDVCYQNLNVKLIGVGAGFTYGSAGVTHHATEDVSIMRSLPNMCVVSPADPFEAESAVKAAVDHKGPVYIRLGSEKEKIHLQELNFRLGKGIVVKDGKDITVISTGDLLRTVLEVSKKLAEKNIKTRIISMHTIKPLDKELILACVNETKAIFTVEEHNLIGGLGSAVSEIISEASQKIIFERMGIPDGFVKEVGNQEYLRVKYNLSSDAIFDKIMTKIEGYKNK